MIDNIGIKTSLFQNLQVPFDDAINFNSEEQALA
jgi:hypothetical protein